MSEDQDKQFEPFQPDLILPVVKNGKVVEMGYPDFMRELHMELCRLSGMTADQIVESWNLYSPDDPW